MNSQNIVTTNKSNRFVVKIGGESGQGINSVGEILAKSLKTSGYYVFGYREYPSLIKGGYACYQVDFSDDELNSSSRSCDLLVCISRVSAYKYLRTLRTNGILLHNLKLLNFTEEDKNFIETNKIQIYYVDTDALIAQLSVKKIMSNTILIGIVGSLLGIDNEIVATTITKVINKSPEILEMNIKCLESGYKYAKNSNIPEFNVNLKIDDSIKEGYLLSGNDALGLGSYTAGVRAYFAYPMTPSSSILSFLSEIKDETKMLVRQVDDEITAAQMMLGAMFMGTRSLIGTSGGGFDLMTESVSLSGITETPAVFILGQRPGPATGLPTWTAQSDLNLAIYSGHGEYPKCVISISHPKDAYTLIQKAFNIAEKYQIPVIVLTEKQIAESLFFVSEFGDPLQIERGLDKNSVSLQPQDRYKITENGISKRWLPGKSEYTYVGNSDEHLEDGSLTEESESTMAMYKKRMKKLETLQNELSEPEYYGDKDAEVLFIGWGSVKNVVIDAMKISDKKIGYLHYGYIFPLKTKKFLELSKTVKRIVIIENNYLSQLGKLITQETGYIFKENLLKFDGRPFFLEDLMEFLNSSKSEGIITLERPKSLIIATTKY